MAAANLHPLWAQVTPKLFIGNFDAFTDLVINLNAGIDKAPLTDVTSVVNLSKIRPTTRPPVTLLNYMERLHTDDEPHDGGFEATIRALMSIITLTVKPSIESGNIVMLVCESGRRQSAILAIMCQLTRGANADTLFNNMRFVYMSREQRERYVRIENEIMSHRFDETNTDEPNAKLYTIDANDKAFYDEMKQRYICLSPQYKKMLEFHLTSPAAQKS